MQPTRRPHATQDPSLPHSSPPKHARYSSNASTMEFIGQVTCPPAIAKTRPSTKATSGSSICRQVSLCVGPKRPDKTWLPSRGRMVW